MHTIGSGKRNGGGNAKPQSRPSRLRKKDQGRAYAGENRTACRTPPEKSRTAKAWRERQKAGQPKTRTLKELAKKRAYASKATKKSRQKMYEEAATENPEAVERYENYLASSREAYHRKKQEAEKTA